MSEIILSQEESFNLKQLGHFLNIKSQKLSIKGPKTPKEKSIFMTTTRAFFFFFFFRIQHNLSMGLAEWQDGAKQNDLVSNECGLHYDCLSL